MAGVLFFLISCSSDQHEEKSKPVVRVKVTEVKQVIDNQPVSCTGVLFSKTESKLSFKTGGIIRAIHVNEGQTVREGQELATLDLSEVKAYETQAKLALEKAMRDFERVGNLFRDSVATLENFQDAETALKIAESNHRIAAFNLGHSRIMAPSNGKILRKMMSENEMINPGMPVFIFAPLKDHMVVRVNLSDKDLVKVGMNDQAEVFFDPYPGHAFEANVSEIANASDPYTGTYEVELMMKPSDRKLVQGFVARVNIFPSELDTLLQVPVAALVDGNRSTGYVYVWNGQDAERKPVQISQINKNMLLIRSGVCEGDLVVTDGARYLNEFSGIEVVN